MRPLLGFDRESRPIGRKQMRKSRPCCSFRPMGSWKFHRNDQRRKFQPNFNELLGNVLYGRLPENKW